MWKVRKQMKEVELVIKIPEKIYESIMDGTYCGTLYQELKNGTILPKGHGRLIDADALLKDVRDNSESYFADDFAHEWVDVAPTIIEADGVKSEEP